VRSPMPVRLSTAITAVPPNTPVPRCSQCDGPRRIVGFLPDIECSECRINLYRCGCCGERSEVTVCSIMEPELS
jgi:hypothetical protein